MKLYAAPFKAFGVRGLIRRAWNNKFRAAATPQPSPVPAEACAVPKR